MKKLHQCSGETLSETLIAIFIIALSAGILSTMAGTAAHLNLTADNMSQIFYKEWSIAEQAEGNKKSSAIFHGELEASEKEEAVSILITGDKETLISYQKEETP